MRFERHIYLRKFMYKIYDKFTAHILYKAWQKKAFFKCFYLVIRMKRYLKKCYPLA